MSSSCSAWHNKRCSYAYDQSVVAAEQWSRLLDNISTQYSARLIRGPLVDPCLTRVVNNFGQNCPIKAETLNCVNLQENCHCTVVLNGDIDRVDSCKIGHTAWKPYCKTYSPGIQGLNEEIVDFYEYMRPLPEEKSARQEVIRRVTSVVTELWPSAKVEVFGSYATGLLLPTSDLDLVILWGPDSQPQPDVMQNALMSFEKQLLDKGIYEDIKIIRTSMPIVKFTDRETAFRVDIGFMSHKGLKSVQFIKEKIQEYPELPYLVLVLKQFLVYHNLLESFNGGISPYCLLLLIVSYLQMNGSENDRPPTIGHQLISILELYGCHFNYLRTGIRIRDGGSYFCKDEDQTGESERHYQYSLLCIEDPLNKANDVGQGCYGAMKVRDAFANAYRELRDAVLPQYEHIQSCCASILGRILLVPCPVVRYRRYISVYAANSSYFLTEQDACPDQQQQLASDDRSDSGSCSSASSNLSSLTKSSHGRSINSSQSSGSAAVSDTESDANSDSAKLLHNDTIGSSLSTYTPVSSSIVHSTAALSAALPVPAPPPVSCTTVDMSNIATSKTVITQSVPTTVRPPPPPITEYARRRTYRNTGGKSRPSRKNLKPVENSVLR